MSSQNTERHGSPHFYIIAKTVWVLTKYLLSGIKLQMITCGGIVNKEYVI